MLTVPDNLIYTPCIPPCMYPIYIKQSRFCILYPPASSHHPVSHIHQQTPITHWWNNAPTCLSVYTSTQVALIMPWKMHLLFWLWKNHIPWTNWVNIWQLFYLIVSLLLSLFFFFFFTAFVMVIVVVITIVIVVVYCRRQALLLSVAWEETG